LSFLNAKFYLPFGSAEVLPHSSGDALMDSEAKASVQVPRRMEGAMLEKLGRDKSLGFYMY